MNKPTVLFATDFSDNAELAMTQARTYAKMASAGILLVHVLEVPSPKEGEGMLHHGTHEDASESVERRLKEIAASIDDIDCEYQLLKGDPADEILRVAEEAGATVVVIGTKGRSGVARLLLGSVAEQVVRKAPCSVLVVKQ